jgi:four helix bundle protein
MLRTYRDLKVWQKTFDLCLTLCRVTASFPAEERFGLTAQIRRAAVSVPSNIAEGYARETTRDYIRHLWIARGSLAEAETQLMLSRELDVADRSGVEALLADVAEVERMLSALIRSLKERGSDRRG